MRVAWVVLLAAAACGRAHVDPEYNYAFVTADVFPPTTFGGDLSGADAICNQAAANVSLGGNYLAYVSSSTVFAPSRFGGARGWLRVDGEPFADRIEDLAAGRLFRPLRIDEAGDDVGPSAGPVATGTNSNGTAGNGCNNWSSSATDYASGSASATTHDWTDVLEAPCATAAHLYCLGIDFDTPLAIDAAAGRRAFVTVQQLVPSAGGIGAADALCASEAQLAGVSGTFEALLPANGMPASSRFDLTGPTWVRLDGVALADSALDFVAGKLATTPSVSAAGTDVTGDVFAGSLPGAVPPDGTCADWTDPAQNAGHGDPDQATAGAFVDGSTGCTSARIYCLEP